MSTSISPPPAAEFTAKQLILSGLVVDRGQLSKAQRKGLNALVSKGLARHDYYEDDPCWVVVKVEPPPAPVKPCPYISRDDLLSVLCIAVEQMKAAERRTGLTGKSKFRQGLEANFEALRDGLPFAVIDEATDAA